MTLWIDAHISPTIAPWLQEKFGIEAIPVRDLDLREAKDKPSAWLPEYPAS